MNRREALKSTMLISGIAISGSTAIALLQSCQANNNINWQPIYFTKEESVFVTSICDVILPKTETPGAVELHVPEFIDLMLNDCIPDAEKIFRKPLSEFSVHIKKEYSKSFDKCSLEEKNTIVENLEEKSHWESNDAEKYSFYPLIKGLSLFGYFNSEYVMKNLLDYQPIPIEFKGCIDVNNDTPMSVTN